MEKAKQHLTLAVDEDVLVAARKIAFDQRPSVEQLVCEYLAGPVQQHSRRQLARVKRNELMEKGLGYAGEITWSRDHLHKY